MNNDPFQAVGHSGRAPSESVATVIGLLLLLLLSANAYPDRGRPNILLLVAEDMSPRVGAFGDRAAITPNLDALAQQGLRLPNSFAAAGVCAPSRAALVTGMHPISIGAQHMRASSRPQGGYRVVPPPDVKAFPELLRAAGYYTFTDTKLDYQFSGPTAGSGPFSIWNAEGRDTGWRGRQTGQPFFGMINFMVSHESGTFDPLGHWPRSVMHFGMQLYRAFQFGTVSDSAPVSPDDPALPPYYPDIPSVRREMARHYNNIHAMDQRVGDILGKLEREGLADTTIVIWTTDHGDGLPRAKRELYDSGIKVPMIIRWPEQWRPADVEPGEIDRRLVSFVDLAPTILSLAGVPAPPYMQGRDFVNAGLSEREYIYAARDRIDEMMDRQRAVRDRRYKYIRSWHPHLAGGHKLAFRDIQAMTRDMRAMWQADELNEVQSRWFEPVGRERLYDLKSDPFELHNLADDPAYRDELDRLRAALDAWLDRVGDMGAIPEEKMVADFHCNGEQCATPPPRIAVAQGRLQIRSEVPGASIGYRLNGGAWRLYTGPVPLEVAQEIEARAVRYGWEESEITTFERK